MGSLAAAEGASRVILAIKAAITGAFAALNGSVLYYGTLPGPSFVHRWVLMAVGLASGVAWTRLVTRRASRAIG